MREDDISREIELGERIPVRHDNFLNLFKVRARSAKVIFVCCFCDPVVYFRKNVTCFAAKHLKFDSHYSN